MMKVVFLNILMVSVAVMSYAQSGVENVASGDSVDVERVVFKIILAWRICWAVVSRYIIIYVANLRQTIM